jgi:hypothetical protein
MPDRGEIHVSYGGNPGSLERIREIVASLGYRAEIRWDSLSSDEPVRPGPG